LDSAVRAVLVHHAKASGNRHSHKVAQRAEELGFALIPNDTSKYVRLVLTPANGAPVTLYLHSTRLKVSATGLQAFAASLPGAVVTARDVQFPLETVGLAALEAFAWPAATSRSERGASPATTAGETGAHAASTRTSPPLTAGDGQEPAPRASAPTPLYSAASLACAVKASGSRSGKRPGRLRTGVGLGMAAALALLVIGNVVGETPARESTTVATSATPQNVEADIAAAEQRLAMAEASEAARPVDALTQDPVTGVLVVLG
jgi:hypothetical protein